MTLPAFLFGFCAATLYGGLMHFWKDGGFGRLVFYLILGWAGFGVGHWLAGNYGWQIMDIGPLHFGLASLGSFIFLGVGHWLSLIKVEKQT
jgi:uncharacterized membrane protein YeaQ/YmgE (transglycosylase-associated protein family)